MSSQVTASQGVVKVSPTLDKFPDDVQLAIIKLIQSWKKSEGTEQEREQGKRARDSALRAVALSCRNLLGIYRTKLLSDVTLNVTSLLSFYLGLARNQDFGKLVRSVTLTHRDVALTTEQRMEAQKVYSEIQKAFRAQGIKPDYANFFGSIMAAMFQYLPNIETLLVLQSDFNIPLQSNLANGRLGPLPFLTHSLKKLSMHKWPDSESNLKARNVVWILVFCNGLRSARLGCVFDKKDFKYLSELSDAFSGLSKVLKLALGVDFAENESIERYWDRAVGKQWIGGNKKTEAIFHLLKVTKNLQCLEINSLPSLPKEEITINFDFLPALRASHLSLESLRWLGLGVNQDDLEEHKIKTNFSLFVKLKVLHLDTMTLLILGRISEIKFPPGLRVLCIPYYKLDGIEEDMELARSLRMRSFPSLKTVDCTFKSSPQRWIRIGL